MYDISVHYFNADQIHNHLSAAKVSTFKMLRWLLICTQKLAAPRPMDVELRSIALHDLLL